MKALAMTIADYYKIASISVRAKNTLSFIFSFRRMSLSKVKNQKGESLNINIISLTPPHLFRRMAYKCVYEL